MSAMSARRFLILSSDVVGSEMAGPGIRYWELAHVLARDVEVTLAVPESLEPPPSSQIGLATYHLGDPAGLEALVQGHDAVLLGGALIYHFPFLATIDKPIVVDLYIPSLLENLEIHATRPMDERFGIHNNDLSILNRLLQVGDFYLCASEKQRDLWLGALAANNRVNPLNYAGDVGLRRLIDVVPFGLSSTPPVHTRRVLKGIQPRIGPEDRVILWGGGIWDWLDPITLIDAVARLAADGEPVRLFFPGTQHPNPAVPRMVKAMLAQLRSEELGVLNRNVFFNDWVPYGERQNYLLEADVGVSLHLDHVETRFSFRTRVLDYIWVGLPMVLSAGDALSDLVARQELGLVVPPQDVEALTGALKQILAHPDPRAAYRERFEAIRSSMTWERVAGPLRAFACEPWRAADRTYAARGSQGPMAAVSRPTPWWALPGKAVRLLASRGPRALGAEVRSYLVWHRGR